MSKKPTAIVSGAAVERAYTHTVRWTSLVVLAVSFISAMVALNGRWPAPVYALWTLSPIAVLGGFGLQAFCTMSEWANRNRRTNPRYFVPLLLDIGTTYVGFAPLLVPLFIQALGGAGLPETVATVIAHIAVLAVAIWFAYYPEVNLVD